MLLGTVTVGATERANAIVLGTAMLGMGLGASGGGRLAGRPVRNFVRVEVTLALLGATAAPALYWSWARLDAFWGPLLAMALAIGACIGAEMPLLAALNDRLARQSPSEVVADYTAADYFGALVGAVAFAFAVRPWFGIVTGTVVVAAVNLVAAAAVVAIVPPGPGEAGSGVAPESGVAAASGVARGRDVATSGPSESVGRDPAWGSALRWVLGGAIGLVLVSAVAAPIVSDGRQARYRDPILVSLDSGLQELTVTSRIHPGGVVDTRLFLDGDLQLSSVDEYRYHESLVHPAIGPAGGDVLVLGGGDCLAVREVLRHETVDRVTLVELDGEVVDLMRTVPELAVLTEGACDDPRLEIVDADAFAWVDRAARREAAERPGFDTIVVDFPDPDTPALGRLYSVELYESLTMVLRPEGRVVVQCGSPFFAPEAYWTCAETLEAAGWSTLSYQIDVPSFGNWGFHLAALGEPTASVSDLPSGLRFLDPAVFAAATVFPKDLARERYDVTASTVLDPTIVDAAQGAWIGYD